MFIGAPLSGPWASSGLMRAILLTALFAVMLLAPVALAGPGEDGRARGEAARAEHEGQSEDHGNETAAANNAERTAWRENATANRTAALAALRENMTSLREAWKENATKIRETCHNATIDRENATQEQRTEFAQCIRTGYAEWRDAQAAKIEDLREAFRALLRGWGWHHKASS